MGKRRIKPPDKPVFFLIPAKFNWEALEAHPNKPKPYSRDAVAWMLSMFYDYKTGKKAFQWRNMNKTYLRARWRRGPELMKWLCEAGIVMRQKDKDHPKRHRNPVTGKMHITYSYKYGIIGEKSMEYKVTNHTVLKAWKKFQQLNDDVAFGPLDVAFGPLDVAFGPDKDNQLKTQDIKTQDIKSINSINKGDIDEAGWDLNEEQMMFVIKLHEILYGENNSRSISASVVGVV